ncbi:hypothetical protein KZX45_14270 [Georgenia sp. EYE_87]|uniref:hypothetical protein n=1 Tax=Georgenia sp. EYE_87 TaxID=2853448 RepID=UPI002002CE86|nr:hypothetical protein [Georgenia sp. EYE_87]MCK6211712.1 hypothetical protein [Georgenia sp. EYE_87]
MEARILGVGVAVLLAACTGPPGGGADPSPPRERPAATADARPTTSPEQSELAEFLAESSDFIPSTHPGLLVVTRDSFAQVTDDGTVDRTRLVPPLPADHEWRCLSQGAPGTAVCLGRGASSRFEPAPGPRCPTAQLERHRVGHSVVTHRTYGPDGRLTQQITHRTYGEHYTIPGTDLRTEGGSDVFVVDDLAPGGSAVRTRRILGTESYQYSFPGDLIWVNHGELRVEDPDGAADVTVVSGRWDRVADPEGARERLCAAFE